ncbi:MAG: CYTH domain-containing protein [Gammaproteobacteria bacterium]|nr:MAG: CYTH domain-containing protein [Gammaproteobacteria bacterium]
MAIEIERKYLINNDGWRQQITSSSRITQGYLANSTTSSIRVRIDDDRANLNIKSGKISVERQEYEFTIPVDQAREMMQQLVVGPVIEKTRYHVRYKEQTWEVDEFHGDNLGLIVAEIELDSIDQQIDLPEWVGEEVSEDPRYYNVNLILHPYKDW